MFDKYLFTDVQMTQAKPVHFTLKILNSFNTGRKIAELIIKVFKVKVFDKENNLHQASYYWVH